MPHLVLLLFLAVCEALHPGAPLSGDAAGDALTWLARSDTSSFWETTDVAASGSAVYTCTGVKSLVVHDATRPDQLDQVQTLTFPQSDDSYPRCSHLESMGRASFATSTPATTLRAWTRSSLGSWRSRACHAPRVLLAFLTLACTGPTTTDSPTGATPTDSEVPRPALPDEVRTLPRTAPAVALMAVLDSEDGVTVEGTVSGPLTVDVDDAEDDRDAFRYAVLDDTGRRLYERTRTSPVIVRDFLDHYGAEAGFDILALLPQLGRFPLQVPLLDEGVEVVFELRQPDGTYAEAGRYALDAIDADDLGLSDQVTGWETLHESGPSEHRLDVVLLGDGYTADQRDEWHSDAADFAAHLLGAQPFADHADRLNLHRVDATSPESGASWDCQGACKTRDTAFDSIFPLQFVNEVLGTSYSVGSILQEDQFEVARAASNVPWDLAVVIVNTNESGGFAVHYASVSADSRWLDTGVHEFGHLMGQLGDEYISDPCIIGESLGLPVNIADDLDALPWAVWIDPDTPLPTGSDSGWAVGAYEGAYNCEPLYRASEQCRMRSTGHDSFCPICTEALVQRLHRYVDPVETLGLAVVDGLWTVSASGPADTTLSVTVDDETVGIGTVADPPRWDPLAWTGEVLVVTAQASAGEVRGDRRDLQEQFRFSLSPE